jgi:hypothetical protein
MKTHPNLIKNSYEIIDEQRKHVAVIFIIHLRTLVVSIWSMRLLTCGPMYGGGGGACERQIER